MNQFVIQTESFGQLIHVLNHLEWFSFSKTTLFSEHGELRKKSRIFIYNPLEILSFDSDEKGL